MSLGLRVSVFLLMLVLFVGLSTGSALAATFVNGTPADGSIIGDPNVSPTASVLISVEVLASPGHNFPSAPNPDYALVSLQIDGGAATPDSMTYAVVGYDDSQMPIYDYQHGMLSRNVTLSTNQLHTIVLTVTETPGNATYEYTWTLGQTVAPEICTACHSTFPAAHPMTSCAGCHFPGGPIAYHNATFPGFGPCGSSSCHGISSHTSAELGPHTYYDFDGNPHARPGRSCGYCHNTTYTSIPGHGPTGAGESGYTAPTAGVNPHGGYTTTSDKCKVCHATHGATAGGEALLRSTRINACVYCHVSATFSISHPYGTNPALYLTEYENNHAATHQTSNTYSGCSSCHSVHGSGVWSNAVEGIDLGMILRADPGATVGYQNGAGGIVAPVTTLTDFCRDCHDGTTVAPGATCSGECHPTQMQVTSTAERNGVSHVMTTTLDSAGGYHVANAVSTDCRSCHSGAATPAAGNSFPHITSGVDFLGDTHTSASALDGVCLDCHQWTSGSTSMGVGRTF